MHKSRRRIMGLSELNTIVVRRIIAISKQVGKDFSKTVFSEHGRGKISAILGEKSFSINYNPDADTYNLNAPNLIKNNIYLDQVVDLL